MVLASRATCSQTPEGPRSPATTAGKRKKSVSTPHENRDADPRLREVRSRQHRLRVLQRLNLIRTSRLTEGVVLDEEVAVGVELGDVALDVRKLRLLGGLLLLRALNLRVQVRLRGLVGRDALHVLRTRLLRLRHEPLVVLLRSLLLVLGLRDAVLELLREHLHQRDHAVALAVLLLVRTPRVRRRRRGSVVLQLHEHRLRRARDHHRRIRRDHVRGAGRREELLLVRQLLLRRLLVEVRAVELEQTVLRLLDQLHRSVVLRLERQELAVLLLTLLRRIGDRLVERLHFRLQGRNLLRKRPARRRHLLDRSLAARDRILRARLLRLALGQVLVTEVLLRVVILLLLAQHGHHAVDLGKNLREVDRLRLQAVLDESQLSLVRPHLLEGLHDTAGLERSRRGRLLLQEAHRHLRERQRLLEQVQRIIVVEDLDGLADRGNLLAAHLAALRPLLLLRLAHRREVRNESLRVVHLRRGVLNVVGGRGGLHSKLAAAHRLRLNRLARGRDLRLLRSRHGLERLHGLLLSRDSAAEVLVHLVLHGLEDADDLARPSAVVAERVLALQEVQDLVALVVVHLLRRLHHLRHAAHAVLLRLDERRTHALLQRSDGARHGIEVGLLAARRLREVSRLLLADP